MEGLFLPLLLMLVVAIPLIMGTRKQKRMMAQQQELQNSLSDGDRVMTTSGMYATVADASDETTIDLEIAEGVVTTWLRQAVREKINPVVDDETSDDDDADSAIVEEPAVSKVDASDNGAPQGAQVAPPLEHGKK
ncbi:preprotein translocase subunit YajC [Prauserella marina]|uniref:Preprotein translocase subunit YajC n=1 Tax=Prauserella marina TaxID=530584 RepID=A0A222VSM3_9PSEU|nr:preprotein translocase subunit YajC [Prauserella marina]ASR36945.1 preprotein translocase subunit YajC [Prauserella marina]PWV80101.1 preprotein translocase subunit YajC [Prauserella marina]SDD83205.1 preprotein translocase subunit YajC [Prauserella marina]